jgi:hypothetical protein
VVVPAVFVTVVLLACAYSSYGGTGASSGAVTVSLRDYTVLM